MKSRFFLVVSIVLFVVSCSQFVNLGDKSSGADNTEGLPDEIYESDNTDTASSGNYDDWNEDNADSDYYDENEQDKYEENDEQNAPYPDEDSADIIDTDSDSYTDTDIDTDSESDMNDPANPDDFPDEDAPVYIFPESDPFPEGFSNVECGCGNTPDYFPVCCDGKILVFNPCFVNCYAINSGGKICSVSEPGLCDEAGITRDLTEGDGDADADPSVGEDGEDDDADETDDDTELPDEDGDSDEIPNECGCYPEDEASIFSCGESHYFITECLASCHCDNPQKIF